MRQVAKILVMALMAIMLTGSAWAFSSVTWDLSVIDTKAQYTGSGGPTSTINFDETMVISNSGNPATVTQQFGYDGQLGNDDTFEEYGIIGLIGKGSVENPSPILFYDANDLAKNVYKDIFVYYSFSDLSGKIINFVDTSDFDLLFNAGIGTIELLYGYNTNINDAIGTLASFELIKGEGSSFNLNAGAGNNADFSFTMKFITALNGFWSIDGKDATTLIDDGLFAYADLNSKLISQTSILAPIFDDEGNQVLDDDGNPTFNVTGLTLKVENSGTMRHAPVPEPGTLLLLGAGLLGLGAVARRRKN